MLFLFKVSNLLNNKSAAITTAAGMCEVDFSGLASLEALDPQDEQDLKDTLPILADILRFIGSAIFSGSTQNMEVVNGFWNVFGGVYAVRVMDFAQTVSVLEKRLLTST
jgi:hypothetical protein